jgi:hypothetical protein
MTNDTSNWYSNNPQYQLEKTLHFWLFLISDILAFICTVFVLYHLLSDRQLRIALQNHVLIIILFLILPFEFIDIPLHLQYLSTGIVRPTIPCTCRLWWFIDWGNYYTIAVLLVFASIERHILIFYSHLVATRRKRLIFHYLPLILITLSMMTFYTIAVFAPVCESTFDYTIDLCGIHACYGTILSFIIVEQIGFSGTSSCLMAIFNMALLIRVIRQKYRIHRLVQWKKQRRLAVQMIVLSLLFLIFSFPLAIIYLVRLFGPSNWADEVVPTFFFVSYYAVLLFPYVCLGNVPDLWNKLKQFNPKRRRRQTAAIIFQP